MGWPKHKPLNDTDVVRNYRAFRLDVTVTEEQAARIVKPFVDMTAYFLDIGRITEIPEIDTLHNSLQAAKRELVGLLAPLIGEPLDWKNLSVFTVTTVMAGGYFELDVKYYEQRAPKVIERSVTVHLNGATKLTTINKLVQLHQRKNPGVPREESLNWANHYLSML